MASTALAALEPVVEWVRATTGGGAAEVPVAVALVVVPLFSFLAWAWSRRYYFDVDELHVILQRVADKKGIEIEDKVQLLIDELHDAYPDKCSRNVRWVLNYSGGIFCPILFIHASIFEYILIWGTPSGNEGITGRHSFVEFHDTVLEGEVLYWSEEAPLRTQTFRRGDRWIHKRGDSGGQRINTSAWCVEYCRGPLPTIMPFGMVTVFFNSLDWWSLLMNLYQFGRLFLRSHVPSFLKGE